MQGVNMDAVKLVGVVSNQAANLIAFWRLLGVDIPSIFTVACAALWLQAACRCTLEVLTQIALTY